MGIRYYAYPVDARQVEFARQDPRAFLGRDPLMDAWGPIEQKPDMLYLDKCWGYLQGLFSSPAGEQNRAALALVAGEVEMSGLGWYSFVAARGPEEVAAIAGDISLLGEQHVREFFEDERRLQFGGSRENEIEYVMHFLADAQEFVARLASEGRGLVYQIG